MIKKTFQILITPFVLGLITLFLHLYVEQTLLTWVLSKIFVVLYLVACLFAFPMVLYSLKKDLSISESYQKTKNIILSLIFVAFLTSIFIYGGALFLIVPGLVFLVWFIFCPYVVIFEKKKGFSALWRSKEIASGIGWEIFGVILAFYFAFLTIFLALNWIIKDFKVNLIVSIVVVMLGSLFPWLFFFKMYKKRRKVEPSPWRPRAFHKVLFVLPVVTGSVMFLFYIVLTFNVLFRDYDPPFRDSHLVLDEVDVVEVKADGNLYNFFKEEGFLGAFHNLTEKNNCGSVQSTSPDSHLRAFLETDFEDNMSYYQFVEKYPEEAEKIVRKNEEAYQCLERMAEHTHYTHFGKLQLDLSAKPTSPEKLLELIRVNSFKSAYLFYEGNSEEALKIITDIAKVGNMITTAPRPNMMEYLIGKEVYQIAFNGYPYPKKAVISLENASLHAEKMASLELKKENFARVFNMEYMYAAYAVDNMAKVLEETFGDVGDEAFILERSSFFWKPEKTKRKFAETYSPIIDLEMDKFNDPQETYMGVSDSLHLLPVSMFFKENMLGRILLSSTLVAIDPASRLDGIKSSNFTNRATRVALVVQSYEEENEELPKNLELLVPEYLPEVPEDPFYEGEEIGYSLEERKIYSQRIYDVGKEDKYLIKF